VITSEAQGSVTAEVCDGSLSENDPQAWRNKKRICKACGNEFVPIRKAQRFCCGGKGRTRVWRERQGLRIENYYGA
jgi:predicted RNA-binding Zn-ribbon protein involved in translation (DUF1610 family)